ncbi:hypothetical protein FRX31_008203 [Thalictrum thalictroides]|uniref:Uncharacterized protein n=1 Tax=Thalictrum thalictroides TaxID=46969 RepID=A0A7J6X043_THATH|nr:hypothetical protein FRX31_008203 [Thalictrum thalictroides]
MALSDDISQEKYPTREFVWDSWGDEWETHDNDQRHVAREPNQHIRREMPNENLRPGKDLKQVRAFVTKEHPCRGLRERLKSKVIPRNEPRQQQQLNCAEESEGEQVPLGERQQQLLQGRFAKQDTEWQVDKTATKEAQVRQQSRQVPTRQMPQKGVTRQIPSPGEGRDMPKHRPARGAHDSVNQKLLLREAAEKNEEIEQLPRQQEKEKEVRQKPRQERPRQMSRSEVSKPVPRLEVSKQVPRPEVSKQVPRPEAKVSRHVSWPEAKVSRHVSWPEAEVHRQVPRPEAEVSRHVPWPEAEVHRQVPRPEAEVSRQVPRAEAEVSRQVPRAEAEDARQVPRAEVEVARQVPRAEAEVSRQVPRAEAEVSRQVPRPEAEVSRQVPRPEVSKDGDQLTLGGWRKQLARARGGAQLEHRVLPKALEGEQSAENEMLQQRLDEHEKWQRESNRNIWRQQFDEVQITPGKDKITSPNIPEVNMRDLFEEKER